MLGGGARGQNIGHLCNYICICVESFSNAYTSTVIYHKAFICKTLEIPKEHTPGFMPWGGTWGQNLGHHCNMLHAFPIFHYANKL